MRRGTIAIVLLTMGAVLFALTYCAFAYLDDSCAYETTANAGCPTAADTSKCDAVEFPSLCPENSPPTCTWCLGAGKGVAPICASDPGSYLVCLPNGGSAVCGVKYIQNCVSTVISPGVGLCTCTEDITVGTPFAVCSFPTPYGQSDDCPLDFNPS